METSKPQVSSQHSHVTDSEDTGYPDVRLCHGCELPVANGPLRRGRSAYCPRCGSKLYRGGLSSLSGNFAIALTCLLIFIPAHLFDFVSIRLFGMMIPATLPEGIWALTQEGFWFLSLLALLVCSIAPLVLYFAVVGLHLGLRHRSFLLFKYSAKTVDKVKHWVMIDVFLVSVAISCFKLQDYSEIYLQPGLYALLLMQVFTVLLLTRLNTRRYWESWQPSIAFNTEKPEIHCTNCNLTQANGNDCLRCESPLHHVKPRALQKTWAYLITSSVCLFPANFIPISILMTNGNRLEDTIMSGVASLITSGKIGIAVIIFVASILVPIAKILGLAYLLVSVHLKTKTHQRHKMQIYFVVKWIGKWSMMDLLVISIMMTLVDRGQVLDFTPGMGAVAFGLVVVLTMLAAETFDPRWLWHANNQQDKKT